MTPADATVQELEATFAELEKHGPMAAASAAAVREAIGHLTQMQREARALVARGGTIEEMRTLIFAGTARAGWVIREFNRLRDPERYSAGH